MQTETTSEVDIASRRPRILLIEDDPVDARAVQRGLLSRGDRVADLVHVTKVMDGVAKAGDAAFDLALLDLSLPDCEGLACVRALHEACPDLPVVVLTGLDDEQMAASAIREGAQDYLLKNDLQPRALHRAIRYAIERNTMRRELQIAQQRESDLKDRFLSHVSHELRTPLTAVMQFVTILQDGVAGPLTPQQTEYLGIVRRNSDQLKRMISTLMDVTRANTGKLSFVLQRIDLIHAVESAVTSLRGEAEKKKITLQFESVGGPFEVVADLERTVEVATNLVENAIKFTPSGGRIQVVVAADEDPHHCRVTVLDTGCGIDADQLEKVFERLHQVGPQTDTCRRGLGLGLHISREIVTRQGGRIWVDSQRGRGSRFQFTLPRFCLASIVRRVAFGGVQAAPGLSVIAVSVGMPAAMARAKGLESAIRSLEGMLSNSMIAGSDAVVPSRPCCGNRHVVVGVARAKAAGCESIVQRVRDELAQAPTWLWNKLHVQIDSWTVELPAVSGDRAIWSAAVEIAGNIEQRLHAAKEGA